MCGGGGGGEGLNCNTYYNLLYFPIVGDIFFNWWRKYVTYVSPIMSRDMRYRYIIHYKDFIGYLFNSFC